jgi:hypothetical protein
VAEVPAEPAAGRRTPRTPPSGARRRRAARPPQAAADPEQQLRDLLGEDHRARAGERVAPARDDRPARASAPPRGACAPARRMRASSARRTGGAASLNAFMATWAPRVFGRGGRSAAPGCCGPSRSARSVRRRRDLGSRGAAVGSSGSRRLAMTPAGRPPMLGGAELSGSARGWCSAGCPGAYCLEPVFGRGASCIGGGAGVGSCWEHARGAWGLAASKPSGGPG